jgi:hypothetical protein
MGGGAFSVFRPDSGPGIGKLSVRPVIIEADGVLHLRAEQQAFDAFSQAFKTNVVHCDMGLRLSFFGHTKPSPRGRIAPGLCMHSLSGSIQELPQMRTRR